MAKRRAGRGWGPSTPRAPTRIVETYGPDVLHIHGPIIPARWTIPMRLAEALLEHGQQQPPPPVVGAILLDTAASGTCISQTAAERLGLKPTRMGVGYGAGGRHENPVYFARLEINISGSRGASSRISLEREVQGLPDLEKPFEMTGLTREGKPTELIGLMGRDLLRFARFRYDGVDGKLDLRFDAGRLPVAQAKGR